MAFKRESFMEALAKSKKVDFVSAVFGAVLVMSKDKAFVASLVGRPGAHVRWYDRTEWETRQGGKARMQAEIMLTPKFFGEEEEE